ncbi:MAG: hypothetical protein V1898_03225 [Patescibacteria group bacterium]
MSTLQLQKIRIDQLFLCLNDEFKNRPSERIQMSLLKMNLNNKLSEWHDKKINDYDFKAQYIAKIREVLHQHLGAGIECSAENQIRVTEVNDRVATILKEIIDLADIFIKEGREHERQVVSEAEVRVADPKREPVNDQISAETAQELGREAVRAMDPPKADKQPGFLGRLFRGREVK